MDKTILIRIVRSDLEEFKIGTGLDWQLITDGLDGFGSFDNILNYIDNATADGGTITSARLTKKDRTITCVNTRFNYNDVVRRQALNFFNAKYTYKIYITYAGQTRWAEGWIYKFSLPNKSLNKRMEMMITFTFANPYLKSFDDFGKDIASVSAKMAFPYLCSITPGTIKGITGGVYNFAQKVILTNDGDVETYCRAVFKATGTVVNPTLIINDEYVRIIDIMYEDDEIVMDFTASPPTIKKNGVNFIGHCDRTSSFDAMILRVGDTEVQFDADDGTNLLKVSIYYNKLYCAI